MQLLLILALLLYGGKGDNAKLFKEFRPILESVGGDEVKAALKEAEELNEVLSAFGGLGSKNAANPPQTGNAGTYAASGGKNNGEAENGATYAKNDDDFQKNEGTYAATNDNSGKDAPPSGEGQFPLAPVAGIADKEILYRLVRYFSENAASA